MKTLTRVWAGVLVAGTLVPMAAVHAVPMNVIATVRGTCLVAVTADIDFGYLIAGGGDTAGNGTVEYDCSNGTTGEILIDQGGNGDRSMSAALGGPNLQYEIYQAAGGPPATVWGTAPGAGVGVTGTGSPVATTVFGWVLDADYSAALADDYSDIVDVTINLVP